MTLEETALELKALESALIFCHARPDGDTLSSGFSLKRALEKLGVRAEVVCADPIPDKYKKSGFLGNLAETTDGEYAAHVAVDCSNDRMLGELSRVYFKNKNTYNIDHHVSNSHYAAKNLVLQEAANAVNVFKLIKAMGVEIDRDLANCLYLGVCTDTGNFAHSNTDKSALEAAAELAGLGAVPNKIYEAMFRNQTENRARLYADVISRLKLYHGGRLGIIATRLADLKRFGCESSDTEGFIDFPLTLGSVEVAVGILEKGNECFKISIRSKNEVDVNAVAATFGGGGHTRASGCIINGIFEDVLDKLVYTVGQYL